MVTKRLAFAIIILFGLLFTLMPETYGELFKSVPTTNVPETDNEIENPEPIDIIDEEDNFTEEEEINENEEIEVQPVPVVDSRKKVFLTFDDGPTRLTPKVLDILREHDVKATFFTLGIMMEKYPEILQNTYNEGHMVLPHSHTHNFAIYSTFDTFYEDFYMVESVYKNILGFDAPPYFRFPGGSSNHSSFKYGGRQFMPLLTEDIKEKGYYYIDWNVSSGDTTPDYTNGTKMLDNIFKDVKKNDFAVILMHDLEKNTKLLEILPEIIERLKEQGYTFRTFRDITQDELDTMVKLRLANKPIVR